MVLISLALQLAAIGLFREYRVRSGDDHFAFGWEMGRIGRSIALGQGFANPYGDSTGPTAWEPPLYPYLIGGVFRVFGIYSPASAWALLAINSLFTALTSIPIFLIAREMMGERLALVSAWIWAGLPYAMYWSVHWIWETTFSPLLLAWVFLLALKLEQGSGAKTWALFGGLWGVLALANASLLSFLPFCGLWVWVGRHRRGLASRLGVGLACMIFFLCLAPWLVRNARVFGHWVFLRDDFGLQLRLGNGPSADGRLMPYLQPNLNPLEFEQFRQLGEQAYAERCRRLAWGWIEEHPGRFAVVSLKRFFYYWNGVPRPTDRASAVDFRDSLFLASSVLALWGLGRAVSRKLPQAGLFLGLVLSYPTVYYFIFPHARYRHPIEPELLILAVFLVSEMGQPAKLRSPASASGAANPA